LDTSVDSEIAQYYLEEYLQGKRNNPEYDSIVEHLPPFPTDRAGSLELLKFLSEMYSVDFAALYLMLHIASDESNKELKIRLHEEIEIVKDSLSRGNHPLYPSVNSYMAVFVPGLLYITNEESGANFGTQRALLDELGIENHFIEIDEMGIIEENAETIAREIRRLGKSEKKIILASASSGGAALAYALSDILSPEETQNIEAWLNIGGIVWGSPLADHALSWPNRWLLKMIFIPRGWNLESVESMTPWRSEERFNLFNPPDHILIFNYVGIPLSGNITKIGKQGYKIMRSEGPNDGVSLPLYEIIPNYPTVLEPGKDHFFKDSDIKIKTIAWLNLIISLLEE
jgi:hypothetical protein